MDKSRNEFEAWLEGETGWKLKETDRNGDSYADNYLCATWMAWQASRKQALEEAASNCDAVEDRYEKRGWDGSSAGKCAKTIRSLEGNATKETT